MHRRAHISAAAVALLLARGTAACALPHDADVDAVAVAPPGTRIDCGTGRCADDARDHATDAACPTAPVDPAHAALLVELLAVQAPGGGAPVKGQPVEVVLELQSAWRGTLHVTPRLTSARLRDFIDVPLASAPVAVQCGRQRVSVRGGPFVARLDGSAHFALAAGEYAFTSVALTQGRPPEQGADEVPLDGSPAARFRIAASDALLVPVLYDPDYLTQITDHPYTTPESYLQAAFARASQVEEAQGAPESHPGFDAMMGVRHLFQSFASMPAQNATRDAWCVLTASHVRGVLGMSGSWGDPGARHGFDYLLGLTPALGGGVACPWLDSQVSGFIDRDLDRQQLIVVHESGHLFGAPHCDDVGNGRGGPLQGYVMCAGEKHPRYPQQFVWHSSSRAAMRSHWR